MGPKPFQDWRTNIISGDANKADNLEQDWELNSTAKMLLLNAYMLKREVGAARLQLVAMTSINSKIGGGGGGTKYSEIEPRSEEHTSELQSLMRISYAVFFLKKKKH